MAKLEPPSCGQALSVKLKDLEGGRGKLCCLADFHFREQENPVLGKPCFSHLVPLFFTLEVTGSSLQIFDVDLCGGGDTGSGKAKQ